MTRNARDLGNAFSAHLTEVVDDPPSPLRRAMLYVLLTLMLGIGVWLATGKLDIVSRAQGKLVPKERLQIVQPLETGKVRDILVEEGHLVEAGAVLMRMDPSLLTTEMTKLRREYDTVATELRRVQAELIDADTETDAEPPSDLHNEALKRYLINRKRYMAALEVLGRSAGELRAERARAQALTAKFAATLPILKKQEKALAELHRKQYGSENQLLELQRERIEMEHDQEAQRYLIGALNARLEQVEAKIGEQRAVYRKRLQDESLKLKQRLQQLEQDLQQYRYRERQLEVRAPVRGIIQELATYTRGTVVDGGTVLLKLVPVDTPLQAEVLLANRDVGFIEAGQPVRVKLQSYEFQKYGWLEGVVAKVSPDALEQTGANGSSTTQGSLVYRTLIDLKTQYLQKSNKRYALRPGMRITAEVQLGRRTALEYLLSPIRSTVLEAGTEL